MHKKEEETLILSRSDVQRLVHHVGLDELMDQLIERLSSAIRHFDPARTAIPARSGFHYDTPHPGLIEWMPLLENGKQALIKVVAYHPANPVTKGLPTIISTLSAYSTATGHLTGIMDGVLPTALRTGAASAIASHLLAHPESRTLGLIGCGAQAVTQLHALSRVFDIENILIYDLDHGAMHSFADRSAVLGLNIPIRPAGMEEVVSHADLLCTATSIDVGAGPLFEGLTTRPHLHINAVGSDFPGKVELPLDFLRESFVCPDFRAQAVLEGECQQLKPEEIDADLTEVVQNPDSFSAVAQQKSVFDSTGWALEDQVIMDLFLEYAYELNLGSWTAIEYLSKDAKNPYQFLEKMAPLTVSKES